MKLEINCKRKTGKFTNVWKVSNTLEHNQWVKEIKRKIKNNLDKNRNGNTTHKTYVMQQKQP